MPCYRSIASKALLLLGLIFFAWTPAARAEDTTLLGYKVTFLGRAYDAAHDTTTFTYNVEGDGGRFSPDLDTFLIGYRECSSSLSFVSGTPSSSRVRAFPVNVNLFDRTYDYRKFEDTLEPEDSRIYSVTFDGNIETGTVKVKVRVTFLGLTAEGELPGASCDRNTLPVCNTGGPYTSLACSANPLQFEIAQSSSDADGDTLTYEWTTDCPNGGFTSTTARDPKLTFSPFDANKVPVACTATLVVSDGTDTVQCSAAVSAANCKFDCNGVFNGPATVDVCGICGGDGNSCRDCAGIPFGTTVPDACGVCGGTGLTCAGCDGIPNSGTSFDICGDCGGDGTSCLDCAGVPNGASVPDACGVCNGDGSTCAGCDGVPNSGKIVDACGVCGGDGTSCAGCDGVPNSGKVVDDCGVCGGDNSSCAGCDGIANSGKAVDECGVCGGDDSTCAGCDGVPNSGKALDACGVCDGRNECIPCFEESEIAGTEVLPDACGICGGDGSSCAGCDGVPNSKKIVDACGVCGGDGTSCLDCNGELNGSGKLDACGVCGGDGSSCAGCDGVANSGKSVDLCGVCGGDNSSCMDCNGELNGTAVLDACGVCGGSAECLGCDGVPNSGKTVDKCGVCGGNDACLDCAGTPNGAARVDRCGVCAGDGLSCLGCETVNIFSTQIQLDGTLNQQRDLVVQAAAKLRKAAKNNKRARKLARKLSAEAANVYADSWRLIYDFAQIQTTCSNSLFCAQLDQSSLIERVNKNAMRLREITELLVNKKKAIKKERRLSMSDHKLVERARRLEITTLKSTGSLPREFSACS